MVSTSTGRMMCRWVGLVFLHDGEEMCEVTGSSAQDEKTWCKRKLKQEQFLGAKYISAQC